MKHSAKILSFVMVLLMALGVFSVFTMMPQEAYAANVSGEFKKYTGALTSGEYLIVYSGGAMKAAVSSSRLNYSNVTISNDTISNPDASLVWKIEVLANGVATIYNASTQKYAAGTGAKNKAQLLASGTDTKSQWTYSGTSTYEFVNVANKKANVNCNLRRNGTYGFACYSTSTGGALTLYKKVETASACEHTNKIPQADGYDATCTVNGMTNSVICSDCKKTVTPQETIPALGHEYVDWKCTRCGEEQPSSGTVNVSISNYASKNGWLNGTKYSSLQMNEFITVTAKGDGSNTGKFYTNGNNWRLYQTENATLMISSTNGIKIVSVKITYVVDSNGVLKYNGTNITTGTVVQVNANTATFSVGNTGTATNGQVRITAIEIQYERGCAHSNQENVAAKAPTCTEEGREAGVVCKDCGVFVEGGEVIPAGHNWNLENICETCGENTYSFIFNENHFSETQLSNTLGGIDWVIATDSGDVGSSYFNGEKGHQFGKTGYGCSYLKITLSDFHNVTQIVINTSGASATKATLTVYVGGVAVGTIVPTDNAMDYTITIPAALSGDVVLSYTQTVDNTGNSQAIYLKKVEVTACNHSSVETDAAVAPNCENSGLTAGSHCAVCGKILIAQEVVDALGHDWSANNGECANECGAVVKFNSASITLQDNLLVNFKIDTDILQNAGVSFVKAYINGNAVDGDLVFSYAVAPHQMTDSIAAYFVFADANGNQYKSVEITYSVATYCENKLGDVSLHNLVVSLLNYGAAAQVAVGYNLDNLANACLSDTEKLLADVKADAASEQSESKEEYSVLWNAAGLLLNDKIVIRFAFEAEDVEGLAVKVEINGRTYTVEEFVGAGENRYYVYIEGLNATQLRNKVSVTVMDGENAVSTTLTYSVEVYATKVFGYAEVEGYENLVSLVKAMMVYGDAAKAYVGK